MAGAVGAAVRARQWLLLLLLPPLLLARLRVRLLARRLLAPMLLLRRWRRQLMLLRLPLGCWLRGSPLCLLCLLLLPLLERSKRFAVAALAQPLLMRGWMPAPGA